MGGSETFRAPTQHKKSKQSPKLIQDNKEAVHMQKMFCKKWLTYIISFMFKDHKTELK
jgi:hypothetical protein